MSYVFRPKRQAHATRLSESNSWGVEVSLGGSRNGKYYMWHSTLRSDMSIGPPRVGGMLDELPTAAFSKLLCPYSPSG